MRQPLRQSATLATQTLLIAETMPTRQLSCAGVNKPVIDLHSERLPQGLEHVQEALQSCCTAPHQALHPPQSLQGRPMSSVAELPKTVLYKAKASQSCCRQHCVQAVSGTGRESIVVIGHVAQDNEIEGCVLSRQTNPNIAAISAVSSQVEHVLLQAAKRRLSAVAGSIHDVIPQHALSSPASHPELSPASLFLT